ncbi:MAG: DMT family transporter [Rhodobacteraceae bacterium]|nr:DMT family transporter [Paracoccaceae bacterium]
MTEHRPLLAALWMCGAIASFTLMAVAGRAVQVEMNTFELMAWRSAIGFAIISAILWRRGFAQVRSAVPWLHVQRNLCHFAGQNLWFFGLTAIPLAQLVALEFTNPIWVALLAPLLLGERFTLRRALAAALGFAGVLIVAQPGVAPVGVGHLAGLGAALGFALNTIYTRRLMAHDSVLCVLFWMTASQGLMGAALGAPGGIPLPSPAVLPWLLVVGLTGLTAHYSLTSALAHAPATVVAPMEFLRLPVIAAVGALVYGEALRFAVFLGAGVIIAANLVNLAGGAARRADRDCGT